MACEALYYMKDVRAELNHIGQLSSATLVTYYCAREYSEPLDQYLQYVPDDNKEYIQHNSTLWNAVWWNGSPRL